VTAASAARRRWPWVLAALLGLLFAAFLALRTPDIPAAELRARYGSTTSQYIELSPGFTVHIRDEGPRDAPALLLIHGSNASLHTWEPWVKRLSGRYRVVTLDLQGHGLTGERPDRCYSRTCMLDTVELLRAKLGIERMAIGGNSMGGAVSWAYALAHPDRVSALILVDSAGAQLDPGQPRPIGFRIARTPVLRNLMETITPRSMIAASLDQSVTVKAVAGPADVDRYWELLRYPGNRRATLDRFATTPEPVSLATFAPLATMPTLILWGEEDRLFAPEAALWFKKAIPNAQLILYPRTGHLPQEETPDRSANDVAQFLLPVWPGNAPRPALQVSG
jgi:pimeloyl-ACP methyl ester carboxylesterase